MRGGFGHEANPAHAHRIKQGSSEGSPSLRRKLSQVFLSLVNESVVVDRGYKYNGVADHN